MLASSVPLSPLVHTTYTNELVTQFHGVQAALGAEDHFARIFQRREVPEEPVVMLNTSVGSDVTLTAELARTGVVKSRSEARRLLAQGAIEIDGEAMTEDLEMSQIGRGRKIKVGKRRFAST